MPVSFQAADISFLPKNSRKLKSWVETVFKQESSKVPHVSFIFCSDSYLLKLNREFLNHDCFTDVITFVIEETEDTIISDIFVSIPRVRENADSFNCAFSSELQRVLIHGTFHLLGYNDKTENEIKTMRRKEEESLLLFNNI